MRARGFLASVAGLALATGGPAQAQSPASDVRIACPALSEEGRARLEARARAYLVAQTALLQLTVRCEAAAASVERRTVAGLVGSSTVALSGDESDEIDAILGAIEQPLEAPAPPPDGTGRPAPAAAAPAATVEPDDEAPDAGPPPASHRVGWVAGLDAELWQGSIGGAAGGHAGMSLELGGPWAATLLVGPTSGIGDATVSAWALRAAAQIEWRPASPVRFSLGATGRMMWASAAALTPADQVGVTGGAVASLRALLPTGGVELSIGPTLDVLVRPITIDTNGTERFRLPWAVAAVTLEGRYPEW